MTSSKLYSQPRVLLTRKYSMSYIVQTSFLALKDTPSR
jgi:hypothetical protein